METAYFVGFSIFGGALVLLLTVVSLIYWARLNGLSEFVMTKLAELEDKAEPKALEDARVLAETTANRVDSAVADLRKFREGVHAEIQRFYGIMRRNEKAVERVEQADEEEMPREIQAAPPGQEEAGTALSRSELRARARKAGHRI